MPGAVHCLTLGPALELCAVGLQAVDSACWVGPRPNGGLALSGEPGDGSVIVADEHRHQVTLFPRAGAPVCLVSEGLRRPLGVACAPQGQLMVADAGNGSIKLYEYRSQLA
ncbi:unnamed protein product [Nyctereutes procyonoides]|uniref:(raccoon dog) hypothetical protein n=1 Tax=Nyctereutes procyonoides TaxID=34880 RepID=A0A811YZY7_NYCPR|nr:unnamed protein product [Nyctereutes procyonoides]